MERKSEGVRVHPRILAGKLDTYLSDRNFTRNLYKYERVLAWLVVASNEGHKVTRFDAGVIGDTCLNSSVPAISKRYGLTVQREWTKVPGSFGDVDCCRYWLEPDQIEKAERLLSNPGVAA